LGSHVLSSRKPALRNRFRGRPLWRLSLIEKRLDQLWMQ
jgi:hypothetical protein